MGDRRYVQQALEHGAQVDHRRRRAGLVNDVWPHKRQHMEATGARNTPRLALSRALSSSPGPKGIPLRCTRISAIESHRPIQTFLHLSSRWRLARVPPSQRSPPASQARSKAIAESRNMYCHGHCPILYSLHASRSRAVTATQP